MNSRVCVGPQWWGFVSNNILEGDNTMLTIFKMKEKGQDLAEYALLLGLIAIVVILAVTLLGTNISTIFSELASEIGTWF